jgi:hypothetical protein
VLEPILEGAIPGDVLRLADMRHSLQLPVEFGIGLQADKAGEQIFTRQQAVVGRDKSTDHGELACG